MVFFANLFVNIDHGVMPAGSIVIRDDLGETNSEYGLLGSIVFAGLVVGSLVSTFMFKHVDTRIILASVIALNGVA